MKKSFILKPVVIATLLSISLSACNSGAPTSNTSSQSPMVSSQLRAAEDNKGARLGSPTINRAFSSELSSDIQVLSDSRYIAMSKEDPVEYNNENSYFKYEKNLTSEDILKKLGVKGEIKGAYKDLSGDFAGDYLNETKSASNEIRLSLIANTKATVSLSKLYHLDPNYVNKAISIIGDSYLSSATAGIFVEATVHVKFETVAAKNNIAANGSIKYGSIVELIGSLENLDEDIKNKISIEVELIQRGGDSSAIFNSLRAIAEEDGGEVKGEPFFVTSIGLANCGRLIDAVQVYVAGKVGSKEPSEFQQQVYNFMSSKTGEIKVKTLDNVSKLYVVGGYDGFSATSYPDEVKKYSPDVDLQTAIDDHSKKYSAMLKKISSYDKYMDVVSEFKDTFPNNRPETLEKAIQNQDDLNNLSANFINHARACYGLVEQTTAITDCIAKLNGDIAKANSTIAAIDAQSWQKGYKLRGVNGSKDNEYLIPLGGDEAGNYYLTYSALPNAAIFAPGSIYRISSGTEQAMKISNIYTPDQSDEKIEKQTLKFASSIKVETSPMNKMIFIDPTYTNMFDQPTVPGTKKLGATALQANVVFE